MAVQILFDRLRFIDRLKGAGIDDHQARAHDEAMDEASHESVATKSDLRMEVGHIETKIEIAVRDMTIRMGGIAIALFAALAAIKYFD